MVHAHDHLADHLTTALSGLHGRGCQLIGLACGIGRLGHGGCQLFDGSRGFFQVGSRLLGTCRQILIA